MGTDLGSLAGKGGIFGPLVKSRRCLVRWLSRPEQTYTEYLANSVKLPSWVDQPMLMADLDLAR